MILKMFSFHQLNSVCFIFQGNIFYLNGSEYCPSLRYAYIPSSSMQLFFRLNPGNFSQHATSAIIVHCSIKLKEEEKKNILKL